MKVRQLIENKDFENDPPIDKLDELTAVRRRWAGFQDELKVLFSRMVSLGLKLEEHNEVWHTGEKISLDGKSKIWVITKPQNAELIHKLVAKYIEVSDLTQQAYLEIRRVRNEALKEK
jgi:hypothetical protein